MARASYYMDSINSELQRLDAGNEMKNSGEILT